jgi:hypothetical protein
MSTAMITGMAGASTPQLRSSIAITRRWAMSREIKFRAWDAMYNEMVYDCLFLRHRPAQEFDGMKFPDMYYPVVSTPTVSQLTAFMQYTGLKDRHNKEVWESDILKTFEGNKVVEFAYGGWTVRGMESYVDLYSSVSDFEVIGNIYENEELLTTHRKASDKKGGE